MAEAAFGSAAVALAGVMARVCGWRPDDFWAATPADAAAVLAAWPSEEAGSAGPDRAALAAMMEQFPDGG